MSAVNNKTIEIIQYDVLGKLPDLFTFDDGSPVITPEDWEKRRTEILKTAVDLQYGGTAPEPDSVVAECLYNGGAGKAASFRVSSYFGNKKISFYMKLFLPENAQNPPVVISGDMCFNYCFDRGYLTPMLDNGIAFAVFDRTEIADDKCIDANRTGAIYELFPNAEFGSISAWAWGYSRCVDALEIIGLTDPRFVVFTGHSRGGKTAMLAGVLDSRALIINPNETNAGSCSCYRIHLRAKAENGEIRRSETLADMTKNFPTWLGNGMKQYADREEKLPFDCHFLKALAAPRILFISEAASDIWGNPVGSLHTTKAAAQVYRLLGAENNLYWYFRNGEHAQTAEDISQLVNLIKHIRYGDNLNENFFKVPFDIPEPII